MFFIISLAITNPIVGLPSKAFGASTGGTYFNYLVVILLENRGINQTYGSGCTGVCTYITQLANQYGLAVGYSAVIHDSLPNYLALTSGWTQSLQGTSGDCSPLPSSKTNCGNRTLNPQISTFPFTSPNIVDRVESAGMTWKAYMEDYSTLCVGSPTNLNCSTGGCYVGYGGVSGEYDSQHDPFVYYGDITNNMGRCGRIVPANSGQGYPDDRLINDLSSTTSASNLMWLTPNLCDDGHDKCLPFDNATSQQNQYLSELVPQIIGSNIFTTQRAALFITYDEGQAVYPNDYVTTIWAGPAVKAHYKSSIQYSHYSLLKTIESNWGLQPFNQTTDGQATSMSEFLIPPPTPNNNQTGLSFTSTLVIIVAAGAIGVIALGVFGSKTRARRSRSSQSTQSQSG